MFKSNFSLFGSEIEFDDYSIWSTGVPPLGSSNDRDIADLKDIFSENRRKKSGGLRKIREFTPQEICRHLEHNPPMHIVLSPGVYEYTCPGCGKTITFTVSGSIF